METSYEYLSQVHIPLKGKENFIRSTLQNEMFYFRTLSAEEQNLFIARVIRFQKSTHFYPAPGFYISERHIILVSSTFVQLTFGLSESLLDHFNHIQLVPAHYRNQKTGGIYKGEVDITGLISLSWEDYEAGIRDAHDSRNVGLHEMAHAFAIEIIESGMSYHHLLMKLKPVYLRARDEIRNPYARPQLLRSYGYSNMHEYFAVATEVFFENPEIMNNVHPDLYDDLLKVFNQDPLIRYQTYEIMQKKSDSI